MEKIPEMIKDLQEAYLEYQEVKELLKKQGKLELLSESNNKPNLSEQDTKYIQDLKNKIPDIQASPL